MRCSLKRRELKDGSILPGQGRKLAEKRRVRGSEAQRHREWVLCTEEGGEQGVGGKVSVSVENVGMSRLNGPEVTKGSIADRKKARANCGLM